MAAHNNTVKPLNKVKTHGFLTHRDAIWDAIRQLQKGFTGNDIQHVYVLNKDTIANYLKGLRLAGYIEVIGQDEFEEKAGQWRSPCLFMSTQYKLVKNVGLKSPRINKHGKVVLQGKARQNMWRTMHIVKEFSIQDLLVQASTDDTTIKLYDAKDYVKYLKRAGYIKMLVRGRVGVTTRYRLIKYTGPQPPMVQHIKNVFDPNTREVVWTAPNKELLA